VNFGAANEVSEEVFTIPVLNTTLHSHEATKTEVLFDHFAHHTHVSDASAPVVALAVEEQGSDKVTVHNYTTSIVGDMIRKGSVTIEQQQLNSLQTSPRFSDIRPNSRPGSAKMEPIGEKKSPRGIKEASPKVSPRVSPRLSPRVLPPIRTTAGNDTNANTLANSNVTTPTAAETIATVRLSSVDKVVKFQGDEVEEPRPISANTREINGHMLQNNNDINNYLELISGKGAHFDLPPLESPPRSPQSEMLSPRAASELVEESTVVDVPAIEAKVDDAEDAEPLAVLEPETEPEEEWSPAILQMMQQNAQDTANGIFKGARDSMVVMVEHHDSPKNSKQRFGGVRDSMLLHDGASGSPKVSTPKNAPPAEEVLVPASEPEIDVEVRTPAKKEHKRVGFCEFTDEFSAPSTPQTPATSTHTHIHDEPSKPVEHLDHTALLGIETPHVHFGADPEEEKPSHVKSTIEFFENLSQHAHVAVVVDAGPVVSETGPAIIEPTPDVVASEPTGTTNETTVEEPYSSDAFDAPEETELDVVITQTATPGQYDLAITSRPTSPEGKRPQSAGAIVPFKEDVSKFIPEAGVVVQTSPVVVKKKKGVAWKEPEPVIVQPAKDFKPTPKQAEKTVEPVIVKSASAPTISNNPISNSKKVFSPSEFTITPEMKENIARMSPQDRKAFVAKLNAELTRVEEHKQKIRDMKENTYKLKKSLILLDIQTNAVLQADEENRAKMVELKGVLEKQLKVNAEWLVAAGVTSK
jgi:hypothetical protein